MVTPVENVIRHLRLCAEIEQFDAVQKSAVARLLTSDDRAISNVLDELRHIRSLTGTDSPAIAARVERAETLIADHLALKAATVARLTIKVREKEVFRLVPMKSPIVKMPSKRNLPLASKQPVVSRARKVVPLFAAT